MIKSKVAMDALLLKLNMGHCELCVADDNIFCNRDCDVQCLDCGHGFCLAHIVEHCKKAHFIADNNNHCTKIQVKTK